MIRAATAPVAPASRSWTLRSPNEVHAGRRRDGQDAAPTPPGSSGSQFFVVTSGDLGLPPDYALLGNVTDGIDVVQKIDELGDLADGAADEATS